MKKDILLHACCAPCASAVLEKLSSDYNINLFYFNPNIQPEAEYQLRAAQLEALRKHYSVNLLEAAYEPTPWQALSKGLENEPEKGKRCELCIKYRLGSTAAKAAELGISTYATTLTISPQKDHELINSLGQVEAENYRINYLSSNFKKAGGYQRSIELSNKYGLYRQNYCGCLFSKNARAQTLSK